ncbi:hypothetical protein N9L06_07840 [Mariniblastus sp.]|nr:hypothetical protein [Mariniblastus sp.]
MSFIEWITRRPGFRSLEDSFAINRESMFAGLQRAIAKQQETCDEVWLVAHFFDTFLELQDFLAAAEIDYQIVDQSVHCIPFARRVDDSPGKVRLSLASLIGDRPEAETVDQGATESGRSSVAIIVCERHPYHVHDKRLFEAAKRIEASITFGYVLSLDDVVVKQIVSPNVLLVLEQLGLDEREMIASHYLSRLLERRLIKQSQGYAGDQDAESAAQWIELNSR